MKCQTVCGRYFEIDDEDYEVVSKYNWYASPKIYIYTLDRGEAIYLHRLLLDANEGELVDHQDRDPSNNRKYNLRKATVSQNAANSGPRKTNTSGYKGVYKSGLKWAAKIGINKKQVYIGTYATAELAAYAYDKKAKLLFGDFAWLNFPE